MSHSKVSKKGKSLYLDVWNPSAKRFIATCVHCGATGFSPAVLESDFASTLERKAIRSALERAMKPLPLNEKGQCESCARLVKS